jgi:hypothetical protein
MAEGEAVSFYGNVSLIENCTFLYRESFSTTNNNTIGGGII